MLNQAVDGEFANAPCACAESLDKPALIRTAKLQFIRKLHFIRLSLQHLGISFDPLVSKLYRGGDNWIRSTSLTLPIAERRKSSADFNLESSTSSRAHEWLSFVRVIAVHNRARFAEL
jgi:hypothetical protein